ncbi:flavin-containing monooxygenase [Brevibacillus choshinensis]|uniref:NAD(P)-binding domain-containing protein n=1 Tax=Brevibacillus choshinensis TaxID=54911 RepID=A0ABX7FW75_BRECH|nr:NAD(P)/FAD-dependent oxidoreductase [Brevibacillus choshinensis]QRG69622.1 NAD(P)-binding domain-containing protein [Brevibacillus choshinensis]
MFDYDVVVVGGGQAGLSIGYYLQQQGLRFIILEKQKRVGTSWRERYDSLVLFTPRAFNDLPGFPFPGDRNGLPYKDEVAHYLEEYARNFRLPILLDVQVLRVERASSEGFRVHTEHQVINARAVVVATGPFQEPFWPEIHKNAGKEVIQQHTATYRNAESLDSGTVLVVGGGNSGVQIAVELAEKHPVLLSMGESRTFLPLTILGKTIFTYMRTLGILSAPSSSWFGKLYRSMPDPIFGFRKEMRALQRSGKLRLAPRTVSISGRIVTFADRTTAEVSNIIWATGYRPHYEWLQIPGALDDHGRPVHNRGISPAHGLFFLGLPWQSSRQSALMGGVGQDARHLATHLSSFLRR